MIGLKLIDCFKLVALDVSMIVTDPIVTIVIVMAAILIAAIVMDLIVIVISIED